jgi:hypothetical protein
MARSRRTSVSDQNSTFGGRLGGLLGKRRALRRSRSADLAGTAGQARSEFEPLENRQLLFSLLIDPGDPSFAPSSVPGYGTVTAVFGYTIPYLAPTLEFQPTPPETATFDFNQSTVGPFASGAIFNTIWRVRHSATTALVEETAQNERQLRFVLDTNQFVSIQARVGVFDPATPNRDADTMRQISFDIGGPNGFDPSLVVVELRLRGDVVATFAGQDLLNQSSTLGPVGRFTFTVPGVLDPAFDEVRITNTGNAIVNFSLDNISGDITQGEWAGFVQPRIFGARVAFSGPIGASAQFLDLYGRDMRRSVDLLKWDQQSHVLEVDLNDDGVPDWNDGIGRIIFSGTDDRTAFTMFGLRLGGAISTGITLTQPTNIMGFYDAFESAGFGYVATQQPGTNTFVMTGLPPGPGTVMVGSPFVRDNTDRLTYNLLTPVALFVTTGFRDSFQGVFVIGGASISSIYLHGLLYGSSQLGGTADRFIVGSLMGNLAVAGDMGSILVGGDAGFWTDDDGGPTTIRTGGTVTIGRTLREFSVAGRSMVNIVVVGDLNNPTQRPARDLLRYWENEFANNGPTPPQQNHIPAINAIFANNASVIENKFFGGVRLSDQGISYGTGLFRNDTLLNAEWVGSAATAVEIHGDLGGSDAINTRQDPSDLYAFAATGDQDITVRLISTIISPNLYFRIVDRHGRTIATPTVNGFEREHDVALRFRPDLPGVYYLVVHTAGDGTNFADIPYIITITGMASTTFGAYRSGGQSGSNIRTPNLINVLNGSMGNVWVGSGFVSSTSGNEVDPVAVFNPTAAGDEANTDQWMSLKSMTITVARDLFGMTLGSDIEGASAITPVRVTVGRHFGTLITARSGVASDGDVGREGDLRQFSLNAGGSIAMLDVRGSVGVDGDATTFPLSVDPFATVVIRSGQNALYRGDIGMFRVGGHVAGATLVLRTSNGSTVGGFLVDQDIAFDQGDPNIGIYAVGGDLQAVDINLGINSDLRFFDTPKIDLLRVEDKFIPLIPGVPQIITDDAGGQVRIQIIGGDANAGGLIRVMPIAGALGSTIGRLEVNLSGGARLQITGLGNPGSTDVISIGRIVITDSSDTLPASIGIDGNSQVDVWRIEQRSGGPLSEIVNDSPLGDIVAIDVLRLGQYRSLSGDLGRTQVPAWGPRQIGPFLGIGNQAQGGGTGSPIPVNPAAINGFWNGATYRPVNDSNNAVASAYGDDVGMPVDPYLNGLIVRTGDIALVRVGGAVGDVIAAESQQQDGVGGNIIQVTANANRVTPAGRFDGIIGNIFAAHNVGQVNIGDGLANPQPNSLATTGIFAVDTIGTVIGDIPGSFISSYIVATAGVGLVDLRPGHGSIVNAVIASMNLDVFWDSPYAADVNFYGGAIDQVQLDGGNLFRSRVIAGGINNIVIRNGFYDASSTQSGNNTNRIEAMGFRNSTLLGSAAEFRVNEIIVGGNLNIVTTTGRAGDMQDLSIRVFGVTTEVSAFNITRTSVESVQGITLMQAMNDFRAVSITAGLLTRGVALHNIRSSIIRISGPLMNLTAGDAITNTRIVISGPDGRLVLAQARTEFNADILSVGPVDSILVTEGSLTGSLRTLNSIRGVPGNVHSLRAALDIDLETDIAGTVDEIIAGRHIGNLGRPRTMLVRGNIVTISAGSQIYNDIRVGGSVTGVVTIGPAVNKPGNIQAATVGGVIAFGRIQQVDITGDFGGRIISYSGGIGVVTINDGSFLASGIIAAYDGDLQNIFINRGNFYGTAHADRILFAIRLNGSDDGVFGDIGINPEFNSGAGYDQFRNQLPPGVAAGAGIPGPRITAGQLGRIILTNGSIFSAFIHSQRAIGTIDVTGDIRRESSVGAPTVIAAGSSIFLVHAGGSIVDTYILAGIRSFGADNAPGGTGASADTVQSGRIETIRADGNGTNLRISAGMDPGPDGQYNTFDERVTLGVSYVREVTVGGVVNNVSVFADSPTLTVSPGVVRAGTNFATLDPDLNDGTPTPDWQLLPRDGSVFNFAWGGVNGTISFTSDRGNAYWDPSTGRVNLVNTSLNSELRVSAGGALRDFWVVSNDDASMGLVEINTNLAGDSKIVIDAYVLAIRTGGLSDNTVIRTGMNTRNITVNGPFEGGRIFGAFWNRDIIINGNYGSPEGFGEARIDALAAGTVTINGNNSGLINAFRDLDALTVTGAMDFAQVRTGNSLGALTAGSMNQSRVSTGDNLGPVSIAGSVTDSIIQAGGDLGSDVASGGEGDEADRATAGSIASVTIGGNLVRSSIVAGALRGPDSFFGTADDLAGPGLSSVGPVQIGGSIVGSNLNTEQYRIQGTGTVAAVTVGGTQPGEGSNFRTEKVDTVLGVLNIRVNEIQVRQEALIWIARIFFNQGMDASSIVPALQVAEVRDSGQTLIPLQQGVDYFVEDYDRTTNSIAVRFSRDVTDRPLPEALGGQAGPGVYRFTLDGSVLRGRVATARLDANEDGLASPGEVFSQDEIVGDAGDKLAAEQIGDIGLYGPTDLDLVLDNNYTPDGLPDPNKVFTLRGAVGDNPRQDPNFFPFGGDTDIYKITLKAGQILRLGMMQGNANFAGRFLLNAAGEIQGGSTADTFQLPVGFDLLDLTFPDTYLIKTTGVYYIMISNSAGDSLTPGLLPQVEIGAGDTGDYAFTIEVFDDRNSGFRADNDSGDGSPIVNAPPVIVFAGPNGVFQNPGDPGFDDLETFTIGNFTFRLDPGPDGVRGTADDTVTGTDFNGITSSRQGANLTTVINSAIGPRGHSGVPGDVAADVDVYHLNNGQPIANGRRITIKIKLAELGANLGSFNQITTIDYAGDVQFGVFDTTGATNITDASLLFSPTDFLPIAGTPGIIATQGQVQYGRDANGDFFITFITAGRVGGAPGEAASYAIYLQGVFNTDYSIEVTQQDAPQNFPVPRSVQNIFIETLGGSVDWLQAGGITTTLEPFGTSVLGFTGSALNGQPVDAYVLTTLISNLRDAFAAAGIAVNISTNRADFEFQPFSTVFLTRTTDPINLFEFETDNYGYSRHSDPFNADRRDEAVVFLPSLADLGFTPSQFDLDRFANALTAAVGRRVGELMGLRMEAPDDFANFPELSMMSSSSVFSAFFPGTLFRYQDVQRDLSTSFDSINDTNFWLGQQNAFALLHKFLLPAP